MSARNRRRTWVDEVLESLADLADTLEAGRGVRERFAVVDVMRQPDGSCVRVTSTPERPGVLTVRRADRGARR